MEKHMCMNMGSCRGLEVSVCPFFETKLVVVQMSTLGLGGGGL